MDKQICLCVATFECEEFPSRRDLIVEFPTGTAVEGAVISFKLGSRSVFARATNSISCYKNDRVYKMISAVARIHEGIAVYYAMYGDDKANNPIMNELNQIPDGFPEK